MDRAYSKRLSPARKMVMEILHHARKVPSLPLGRRANVAALAQARRDCGPAAPSWLTIFIKAYGLTARVHPELRTAFIPYPWRRLYVHPSTVCGVIIEREWQGELIVLTSKIRNPEEHSLTKIQGILQKLRSTPVWEIADYRRYLRMGSVPGFLRRFGFWSSLYFSGAKRAKRFGTCTVGSLGHIGVEQYHPLSPLTTYFCPGPIEPNGDVLLKIIYDHRVMDGMQVGRCLQTLDQVLNTQMLTELRELAQTAGSSMNGAGEQAA